MPPMLDEHQVNALYTEIVKVKHDLLSALDNRYLRNTKQLLAYASPRAMHRYNLVVIRSLTKTLVELGEIPESEGNEILAAAVPGNVSKEEQWQWEKNLKHDVRGLVEAIGVHLSDGAKQHLYKGPTSYDILNTSYSLAFRDAALEVIAPASIDFIEAMLNQAQKHKETVMPGRTHRQHAVPTTFGHYLMEVVQGFGEELNNFIEGAKNLRGKFSGICGNRASYRLLYSKAWAIEDVALSKLDLKADPLTGQVVHQHYYSNYFHSLVQMGEYLAKFANDMRSFQQTEIGEVYEKKPGKDVGSSTAAQKANPINSENIGGHQRKLRERMQSVYEDSQIDFERDLRNSSSMRYYTEMLGIYMNEVVRATKIAKNMWVRPEVMKKNLGITKGQIVAEAVQLYIGKNGLVRDAHEYVKNLARICQTEDKSFEEVLKADEIWEKLPDNIKSIVENPSSYTGASINDTEIAINYWKQDTKQIRALIEKNSQIKYL